ncbi:MAG: DUF4340 domain-containing protein [Bacillota bacterium]|nr:DUF4340 domain-containing protein [Bacillota bacterium]
MKKWLKLTLMGVLVLSLAVCAYIVLKLGTDPEQKTDDKKTEEITVDTLNNDITEIYLTNKDGSYHFVKKDKKWKMVFNQELDAEGNTIVSIDSILKKVIAKDLIEKNTTVLSKYGLDQPQATVKYVLDNGTVKTLKIGDSIVNQKNYFTLDDKTVYTMANSDSGLFLAGMSAFINMSLTSYKIENVSDFALVKGNSVLKVGKKSDEEVKDKSVKSLMSFKLTEPVQASASPDAVKSLYESVLDISANGYLPYAEDAACGITGNNDTYFQITDINKSTETFYVGSAAKKGYTYVKRLSHPGIFVVSDDQLAFLKTTSFDIIDKHISLHYLQDLNKVVIKSEGNTYTIERTGDKSYTLNGKKVDYDKIANFYEIAISLTYDGVAVTTPGTGVVTEIGFYTDKASDVTQYSSYDPMSYSVTKEGVQGFTIKKKYVDKVVSLVKELAK